MEQVACCFISRFIEILITDNRCVLVKKELKSVLLCKRRGFQRVPQKCRIWISKINLSCSFSINYLKHSCVLYIYQHVISFLFKKVGVFQEHTLAVSVLSPVCQAPLPSLSLWSPASSLTSSYQCLLYGHARIQGPPTDTPAPEACSCPRFSH